MGNKNTTNATNTTNVNTKDDINFEKALHMACHKSILLEQNIIPAKSIIKLPNDIRYSKIKVNDECFEYSGKYSFFAQSDVPMTPFLVTIKYSEMDFVQLNTDDMQNGHYLLKECPTNDTLYMLYKNDNIVLCDTYVCNDLLTAMNIFM